MSDEQGQPPAGETPEAIVPQVTVEGPISTRDAARALSHSRWSKKEQQAAPAQAAPEMQSISQESDADPAQQERVPGETQADEPGDNELPSIDPPRSWTKEARERFQSLPRETQEYIAEREQERDREVRRSQNEAAEERKAIAAERDAAAKARQDYEAALPQLMQALQHQMAGDFSDVKTWADIERMATDDPVRYNRWNAQQQKLAAIQTETQAAEQRKAQEQSQSWAKFADEQDRLFAERIPDIANPDKAAKLRESAVGVLKHLGFDEHELASAWNGQRGISLRDHRVQLLIMDAMKYRDAQEASRKITAAPKPAVQRPGSSHSRPSASEVHIEALTKRLETARGVNAARVGADLLKARREASKR